MRSRIMVIPPVSRYMTPNPHAVAPHTTVSSAGILMRHYGVRHMPVLDNGVLVAMLTDRDVLPSYALDDKVADVMDPAVTTVLAVTPIDEVVALMRARHVNAVIVAGTAGVEGIFTRSDVMRAFCDLIRIERVHTAALPPLDSQPERNRGTS